MAMETNELIDVHELTPFKKFIMSIGAIPTSYLESMSYAELLMWFCNYLQNTVIPTVNNNGEAVEELQGLFVELHNYVEDYFDNLDVQEEINNKLDNMAEDGTLTNLIKNYVDPIYEAFETSINGEIEDFETSVNNSITNITNRVNGIASGSPTPVSSTSAMTDTSKVYVNTTDGKWYYYNGSVWTAGGTYQSTGIGEKTVTYINENDLLRNINFRVINADDIVWKLGYTVTNGKVSSNWNTVASQMFLAPKGSTISTSSNVLAKVSQYYLNKQFKGDSGGHQVLTNYTLTDDCYVRITLMTNTSTPIAYTDGNSTNVQMTGIVPIDNGSAIINSLKFNQYTTSFLYSDRFYVNAGTKIKFVEDDFLDNNNQDAGYVLRYGVREAGVNKVINESSNYIHTDYTVQNDGFIQLLFNTDMSVTSYTANKIKNLFSIELNEFEPAKSEINCYISNNKNIDIIEYNDGLLAFNFSGSLTIYNANDIYTINFSSLESTFNENIIEIYGTNYITIPILNTLNYNIKTNTVYLSAYNTSSKVISDNDIVLLANSYSNATHGLLLDIYKKNQSIKGDAERLNYQLFNSSPFIKNYDWITESKKYSYKLNNMSDNIEKFFFFTDPHLLGSNNTFNETRLRDWMSTLEKIYNSSPADYIVCGGDWLIQDDTQDFACFKLGYMDGFTKSLFKNYYPILGNHDTNYQGKLNSESEANTGTLTNNTIINLMFNEHKKMYYSFNGINSKNYVLDSGIDWTTSMDSYRWEQINWLGNKLLEDNPQHAIVMMHIIWNSVSASEPLPFTDNVTKLLEAFNHHESITLNSLTYDFTQTTGHVDYVLGGHLHTDHHDWINNILCIATTTFALNQTTPTFDMIINDYDNNKAYFVRCGSGESREFQI